MQSTQRFCTRSRRCAVRGATIVLFTFAACAQARTSIEVNADHPAGPSALEAPSRPASTVLDVGDAMHARCDAADKSASRPDAQAEEPTATVTYTCPMHVDVRSGTPGRCPKCGMYLLQKSSDEPDGGQDGGAAQPHHDH